MSTRANIKILSENDEVILYRHCDGYPSGLGDELKEFISTHGYKPNNAEAYANEIIKTITSSTDIEFTSGIHSDIKYMYVINLVEKEYSMFKVTYEYGDNWRNTKQHFLKIK